MQHRVEGRRRPDPEGERPHRDGGEADASRELAQRKAKLVEHGSVLFLS